MKNITNKNNTTNDKDYSGYYVTPEGKLIDLSNNLHVAMQHAAEFYIRLQYASIFYTQMQKAAEQARIFDQKQINNTLNFINKDKGQL